MNYNNSLKVKVERYIEEYLPKQFLLSGNSFEIKETIISNYNINYIIEISDKTILLRLNIEQQSGLNNQIEYEYKTLKFLEGFKIAPHVYFMDSSKERLPYDFLIEEYIPGPDLNNCEIKKGIIEVAKALSILHSIPIPSNSFFVKWENPLQDLMREILNMYDRYKIRKSRNQKLIKIGRKLLKNLREYVDNYAGYFKSESLIHTDVVNDNFICADDGVKIIDWEKPRIDDATYDLCVYLGRPSQTWGSRRIMNKEEKEYFISEYCKKRSMDLEILVSKINIMQPFVSFRWVLWAAHRKADVDEKIISPELNEFYSNNYHRYRNTSDVSNIEQLLDVSPLIISLN